MLSTASTDFDEPSLQRVPYLFIEKEICIAEKTVAYPDTKTLQDIQCIMIFIFYL
jgi:hypothetical protein